MYMKNSFDILKNFVGAGGHKVGNGADMERLGYESDGNVQGEIPKESIQIFWKKKKEV